jgi:DNA-binding transcriptional regulator YhcF (GntR family)
MRQNGVNENGPIYQRLARLLEGMIQSRSLSAGDRMPSVRQFSSQQKVSVPTALQAYITLETGRAAGNIRAISAQAASVKSLS